MSKVTNWKKNSWVGGSILFRSKINPGDWQCGVTGKVTACLAGAPCAHQLVSWLLHLLSSSLLQTWVSDGGRRPLGPSVSFKNTCKSELRSLGYDLDLNWKFNLQTLRFNDSFSFFPHPVHQTIILWRVLEQYLEYKRLLRKFYGYCDSCSEYIECMYLKNKRNKAVLY